MRRYAPAFLEAVKIVRAMKKIDYARVRDIIGLVSTFFILSVRVVVHFPSESEPILCGSIWNFS
jgi:hypothetical protein